MRFALTSAARIVDSFNFLGAHSSIEELYFIDPTGKEFFRAGILVVADEDVAARTGKNRAGFCDAVIKHAIDIDTGRVAVVSSGNMIPGVVLDRGVGQYDIVPRSSIKGQSNLTGPRKEDEAVTKLIGSAGGVILFQENNAIVGAIVSFHYPGVDRDGFLDVLIDAVRDSYVAACPIKVEGVAYFAGCEGSAADKGSVVVVLIIERVIIGRPPTNHPVWRRRARALTFAAGIVDFSNFALSQGTTEDLYFVNQPLERISSVGGVSASDL